MKMLCIRGRQHPAHTGVVAGEVYDVEIVRPCCLPTAHADGSVFRRAVRLRCAKCGSLHLLPAGSHVRWGPDRFVPWNPPRVSKKEVRELYAPSPRLTPEDERQRVYELEGNQ